MRLLTKIQVVFAAAFILSISLSSVFAVTRTISDTQDTVDTYIRNSNGNYYAATFANLQTSLNLGGVTTLPVCNISIGATGLSMSVSGTQLNGQGNSSVLFLSTGTNYRNMINVTAKNALIYNIRFDANNRSQTNKIIRSIFLTTGSENCTIDHCIFVRSVYAAVYVADTSLSKSHIVKNCYIDGRDYSSYGGGIIFRGPKCMALNNIIKNTYSTGILMEGSTTYTKDFLIDGNYITGYISVGIYMELSSNATIINNIIKDINSTAYAESSKFGILVTDNCIVSNNYIYNATYDGISATGNGDYNKISNNRIYETRAPEDLGAAILVNDFCTVIGNTIYNNVYGNSTYSPLYGIRVGDHSIVTGNIIESKGNSCFDLGIDGRSGNYITISDNHINGSRNGIKVSGKYNIITGNNLVGSGLANNPAILLNAANFTVVSNNIMLYGTRGIRLYKSSNCTVTGNIVQASGSGYSIYEDTAPANYNSISFNNLQLSTTKVSTLIGTSSWEMLINGTTAKIGIHTSTGTTWK